MNKIYLFILLIITATQALNGTLQNTLSKAAEDTFCFGVGMAFESVSSLAEIGQKACSLSPQCVKAENELLLFRKLSSYVAQQLFIHALRKPFFPLSEAPPSHRSWRLNRALLSQVPADTDRDQQCLRFLEERWLAKSSGFVPFIVDWICPHFGIDIQVHPKTTHSYARDPWHHRSQLYEKRVEEWKQSLAHPFDFPLILTRCFELQDYLPFSLSASEHEDIASAPKIIADMTQIFPNHAMSQEEWTQLWEMHQLSLLAVCKQRGLNPSKLICIQRLRGQEFGGIRLLPFGAQNAEEVEKNHQFLLEWVSCFGLSANRVDLDRPSISSCLPTYGKGTLYLPVQRQSKEEFISFLDSYDREWKSDHFEKNLMVKGTLQLLKDLLNALSEDHWLEIKRSPTRFSIVQLSFFKIKEQLKSLAKDSEQTSFFNTVSHLEEIHADLSSLLEIFSPFSMQDFLPIYRELLVSIPENLKRWISCGVHSSGMSSLTGILKAVEKTLGKRPHVLYGENTYYEGVKAVKWVCRAVSVSEAAEEDWENFDLLLAQFNPILNTDPKTIRYGTEKIADILHKTLKVRKEKPLTLALDCTIDYIDSPRVHHLVCEFQKEIEAGILNIVCFRSGLKFDLFGMDNYSGAPFYMIHNQDPKWTLFDSLHTDPALQTDRLSLNWFCLAYKSAASYLELYRKQIFSNTRTLLNKIPASLFKNKNGAYRISWVEEDADPAFIDVKVSGPLHQMKCYALVGGILYTECLKRGHPLFTRLSLGFTHPNFFIIPDEKSTTLRLTLGLDPAQVDLFATCFETIDHLNGPN